MRLTSLLSTPASVYAAATYLVSNHHNSGLKKLYSIHFAAILNDSDDTWGKITDYLIGEHHRLQVPRYKWPKAG